MKVCRGCEVKDPRILDLGSKWTTVVKTTLLTFYPCGNIFDKYNYKIIYILTAYIFHAMND
jgi:hypothetical protein